MLKNKAEGGRPKVEGKSERRLVCNLCVLFLGFSIFLQPSTFNLQPLVCAQEKFVYDDAGKRNPFTPFITADGRILKLEQEDKVDGLTIEGIIYDEHGNSYAIVDGVIVEVGDTFEDYQVLSIKKDRVVFIKEGRLIEAQLLEEAQGQDE